MQAGKLPMTLQERIALATRHVEAGRRIVARQREIVATGVLGARAQELLELFERSQDIFEADLADLLTRK
jgi:hypothetical protein